MTKWNWKTKTRKWTRSRRRSEAKSNHRKTQPAISTAGWVFLLLVEDERQTGNGDPFRNGAGNSQARRIEKIWTGTAGEALAGARIPEAIYAPGGKGLRHK